jgi:hypothetical protein
MPWWLLATAPPVVLAASWLRWRARDVEARRRAAERALLDGDFERAAALFESLRAALELARLYALRGDLARAEAARQRVPRPRVDRATVEARLHFVDALIATRRGELGAAWDALTRHWARFETSESGWLAEACLLRGFLAAQLGGSVEIWLGLDEAARARVHWMAAEWPELRAFIGAHDDEEPG